VKRTQNLDLAEARLLTNAETIGEAGSFVEYGSYPHFRQPA
jgi:hypothetical protein